MLSQEMFPVKWPYSFSLDPVKSLPVMTKAAKPTISYVAFVPEVTILR